VKRFSCAAVLLFALSTPAVGRPAFGIWQAQCSGNGTPVAQTSDFRLVRLENGAWAPLSTVKDVLRLWRSPDGRIFAVAYDPWRAVHVPEGGRPGTSWMSPDTFGSARFTSLDGVDVVTPDRIYRLDPGGALTDLGEPPVGGSGQPLHGRAPEILVSGRTIVVCTGTSHHPDDNVGGSCREARGAYLYRADFGDPLCCEAGEADFTDPFVCGDAVISAIQPWTPAPPRARTQVRALATGALLGRRDGAARQGSACLDGKRALLVGKRDIEIVSVPGLRRLWRERMKTDIGAVAVCGAAKAFVIPRGDPYPVRALDLAAPQTFGRPASR
jgi:hypothetical protein